MTSTARNTKGGVSIRQSATPEVRDWAEKFMEEIKKGYTASKPQTVR